MGCCLGRAQIRVQLARQLGRHKFGDVDVACEVAADRIRDPDIDLTCQQVEAWFKTLRRWRGGEDPLERSWRVTCEKLRTSGRRWAPVKGPSSATMAYLLDLSWSPESPYDLQAPPGRHFNVKEPDQQFLVLEELKSTIEKEWAWTGR